MIVLRCSIIGRLFVACPPSVDIYLSVCLTLDCVQFSKTDCASVRFNVDNGNKTSPWLVRIRLSYPLPKFRLRANNLAVCLSWGGWNPNRSRHTKDCPKYGGRGKGRIADHSIFHTKLHCSIVGRLFIACLNRRIILSLPSRQTIIARTPNAWKKLAIKIRFPSFLKKL